MAQKCPHCGVTKKTKPVIQWAEEIGMQYKTLLRRVSAGWTPKEALTLEVFNARKCDQRRITHTT